MRLKGKWIFIAIFVVAVAIYYLYGVQKKATEFNLDNWNGEMVSMERLRDKVVVLTFSYAYCSVRCPVVTARLAFIDEMMNSPENLVYLHVSVDPEMDTHERRKEYFKLYRLDAERDNRWMFVSGQRQELSRLWDFYGIEIEKITSEVLPEGYYMEYTPKVVIIDKEGFIRHVTDVFFSDDEIIRIIEKRV